MSGGQDHLPTEKSDEKKYTGVICGDRINVAILACQVVQIAILLFTIWILLCAIIYGYKTKKWRKRPGSNILDQGKMYTCCVTAIALTLPRIIFTGVMLFVHPDILSPVCEAMMDTSNGLYFLAMYPAYFYLWLRHRAIYSHPAAQKLEEKCVILSGWAVLLILTSLSIALEWVYIAPKRYAGSPKGCVIDIENNDHDYLLYALAGLLATAQISFLALFIYPMVHRELDQTKKRSQSVSSSQEDSTDGDGGASQAFLVCRQILCGGGHQNSEQGSSIGRTIRRSFYGAIVAMTSDITVMAVASFIMFHSTPRVIICTLYDVSILINSLCILSTFGNNRKILRVLCACLSDISSERRVQESTQIIQNGDNTRENEISTPNPA